MSREEYCQEHSGHIARIVFLEENRQDAWNAINRAHERIDGIKNWVIAGMTSLVLQLIILALGVIFAWMKIKGMS